MESYIYIHNSRCSKSREALSILEQHGIKPQIINYLDGELTKDFLTKVIEALKVKPKDLLRLKDVEANQLKLDLENDEEVIQAILSHPSILERPIILKGKTAVIGRPPENVLTLID